MTRRLREELLNFGIETPYLLGSPLRDWKVIEVIDTTYTPIKLDFGPVGPGAVTATQAAKIPNASDPSLSAPVQLGFILGVSGTVTAAAGYPAKVTVYAYDKDPEGAGSRLIYEVELAFAEVNATLSDSMTGEVITFRDGLYLRIGTDQAATSVSVSPVIATGRILPFTG